MCDKCVYIKETLRVSILIICSNHDIIKSTERMLISKFDIKDLGVTDVILGMKISRTSDGLVLS